MTRPDNAPEVGDPQAKGPYRPQDPPAFLVAECITLDPEVAPTGLRWRQRPKWHFTTDQAWRAWNTRYAGRPIAPRPNNRGDFRVVVRLCGREYALPTRRVAVVLQTGAWPGPLRRQPGRP
jgi:hypothetical protein